MKTKIIIFLLMLFSLLVKTTLVRTLTLFPVFPDISLIALVFIAVKYGSTTGQVAGFATGLLEDFISLAPLGFNSLIRMITGQITGLFQGRVNPDPVLFPILSVIAGTLLKRILSFVVTALFSITYSGSIFSSGSFIFELVLNALATPLLFFILKVFMDWVLKERNTL